jgi:cellulose synthase/poly-beta-1,6-N-acetylglucosamine synthase-like glycosyltransferase
MFTIFLTIYLLTFILCLASYVLYPVIIWAIGKIRPFSVQKAAISPSISVIIPAYNEAHCIQKKIRNTLALEYPEDKIEILIGSDGSADETVTMAEQCANEKVKIIDFKENRGKTAVQNDLVNSSKGELLAFTDAASFLSKDALRMIARNFADKRVGCVAGRMRFNDTDASITAESQGIYWKYESRIRELESKIGNLIGVDGPLYAVRCDSYAPLESNMISDLLTPLLVLEKGKKVVWEPDAVVREDPTQKADQEFNTRRRITLRGLTGLAAHARLLNPLKHPILAVQIIFHKILRWFVGPIVVFNILSCLVLAGNWLFFKAILVLYLLFFLSAGLGWYSERNGLKSRMLAVPYYFSLVNLAATMGIFDFLRKKQAVSWKPVRN